MTLLTSEHGLAGFSMKLLAEAKARIDLLGGDLAQAPDEIRSVYAAWADALMSGSGIRAFTYLLILLLVGSAVEWLYWTYAFAPFSALDSMPVSSPRQALRLALRRFVYLGAGLMLFTVAAIGASAAFSWPRRGVHELVVAATLLVLVLRLAWVAVAIVLAPGRPRLKLVPVEPRRARWLAAAAMAVVLLLALAGFVPELLERIAEARHAAAALRLVIATLAALLLIAAAFAFIGRPLRAGGAGSGRAPPRLSRTFVAALTIIAVYAIWLLNSTSAALIAAIVAIVIALQMNLRDAVYFFWNDVGDPGLLPGIVLSAARFVVVLLGLGACAIALDTPVAELATSEKPLVLLGLRLLGVAALVLLANVIWIAVKTSIDHRLGQIKPSASHDEPGPGARLLTLLPLLRVTAAVLLAVLLVMSSLWALGIEITPLLAGAGVIGLALGFGAQALVRDVIAGIFFLAEDAFRIGEYIESGTAIKGTVERITLRTVVLRHHNGPLHFVPYGALGTVRNTSRDWVIEKFNIPLPIDVESEKIRKMIKKVGEDMMADPDVGQLLIEPLKGKLYRIDPGVKIFRCKFRTAPGKQFDVRAQALKRIEAALKALGVGFADGMQTVLLPAPPAA